MKCPKCVGNLEEKTLEKVAVDACFVCEGLWFDAGELEAVLKADSKDFDFIDVGREEFDGKELSNYAKELDQKASLCPRCTDKTPMVRGPYKGKKTLNVDMCPKGHGLWLDGGEIRKLRNRADVEIAEKWDDFKEMLRYMFSSDGFGDLMRQVRGR